MLLRRKKGSWLFGPSGFEYSHHRRTSRPSVERIRRKALPPFGSQAIVGPLGPKGPQNHFRSFGAWVAVIKPTLSPPIPQRYGAIKVSYLYLHVLGAGQVTMLEDPTQVMMSLRSFLKEYFGRRPLEPGGQF